MVLYKVYRLNYTPNTLGVSKSFEKTFSSIEETKEYVSRQKWLLTQYEGLTLGSYNPFMATFCNNEGELRTILIMETETIDPTKKYKISFNLLGGIDSICCDSYREDDEYLYTDSWKIEKKEIVSITSI